MVIGTEFTIIQSFVTKVETLMILLLMIISASNGKYYLIETNDNDNKTGQGRPSKIKKFI